MKSNRTPFTDICQLIAVEAQRDKDGYEQDPKESETEVFCSVNAGVVRSEFYEAYKAGIRLSVTVELWENDYSDQTFLEHEKKRYKIVRTYPTGHGTLELTCSEVIR